MTQNLLNIFMLAPRGFCAGVERAVLTVEQTLAIYGPPIYVKHQIVHNRNIIEDFQNRGVVFVNSLDEVPSNAILIFNAHGVTKTFEEEVKRKQIKHLDATCPLVKKVHKEALKHQENNKQIIVIGHKNHPEVIATTSRINSTPIIIEDINDATNFTPLANVEYAFVTQTTLSVDYINQILEILNTKITNLIPSKNICYATQNRQNAIKQIIKKVDGLIIVGSNNSSNSNRLKEIGDFFNIKSYLVDNPNELPLNDIKVMKNIAISAGASSPDYVVNNIVNTISNNIPSKLIPFEVLKENVKFTLPKVTKF